MGEDLSHDAHLRAALRHAPDHALTPPSGLTQTILAAAHRVHRPTRAVRPQPPVRVTVARPRVLAWWSRWFSSPRWAGTLATGLVAALGLGLWLDLDTEPAIERAAVPVVEAEQRADATPPGPAPATPAGRSDAPVLAAPTPAPARVNEPAPPTAARDDQRGRPKTERREAAANESRADASAANSVAASPARPSPPPAPPSTAAAPLAQASDAAAPATDGRTAASPNAVATPRQELAVGGSRSPLPTGATAEPVAAASPALTLLRRARRELAEGTGRWSWLAPGASTMTPFDETAQAWLLRLVQSTRGRWTDVAERSGAGEAIEVRWWHDDWPHATLRIETEGLRWIDASGRIRYAPLDVQALQRLRAP